jgi:predicted RecB family nuclease
MRRFHDQPLLSPSDLNDLLECRHLMALKLAAFEKRPGPRPTHGAHTEILVRYGEQHEQDILERFVADGFTVERIETGRSEAELEAAVAQTLDAMRRGVEVIHQAALVGGGIGGYADFLERVERQSSLGAWSYEVSDAKLARITKTYFLVQLSAYAGVLDRLQGHLPEQLTVLLGNGKRDKYRTDDFAAYVRALRGHANQTISQGLADTYPLPCSHCGICGYRRACEQRRIADDHLSLVAGLRRDHVARLQAGGVPTMTALAELPDDTKVSRVPRETLHKLRRQAALQLYERQTGEQVYELLPYQDGYGFAQLPEPAPGDLFFDIEGDPYIGDKGLEYLFGVGWLADDGSEAFTPFWAHDRAQERVAFEELIDFFMRWLSAHPGSHIYHYASYEEQALKTLSMWHGTREEEVDQLLRSGALVDLFRVLRQGLRISKHSYSLKQVESFYWREREAKVKEAGGSIVAYERWLQSNDQEALDEIALYNAEDVHSTRGLRDWLLELRQELVETGAKVTWRPDPEESEATEKREAADAETAALREWLRATGDADDDLLAELLIYHRREAKPTWWWYFERRKMSQEDLRDDDEAIAGLEPHGDEGTINHSRMVPMRFPLQQFKLGPGKVLDPVSGRSVEVLTLDAEQGTLELKLGRKAWGDEVPGALIPGKPYNTDEQQEALRRLARSVLDHTGGYPACRSLLARALPAVAGHTLGAPLIDGHFSVERAVDLALRLDHSTLAVQGPPGTGKTYTGAQMAVALMRTGRRVGVTAPSHKAIHNLLEEIERVARGQGFRFRGFKRGDGDNAYASPFGDDTMVENVGIPKCEAPDDDVLLLAGTSWLFARPGLEELIDTLLIDEAGQVSLADSLAVGTCAQNLILLGDPQQLSQVAQGGHPEQTAVSSLGHLLGDHRTMPAEHGLFVDVSRRMHPDVCRFVSEISYSGELTSLEECRHQVVTSRGLAGAGLRALLVEHAGNRRDAREEAEVVLEQVNLLDGGTVTLANGRVESLHKAGVMVVTPYNAQVRRLRGILPGWVEVGTVDKFQGREAAVVFFSMATSSGEDMPRNVDFLYSRNRLNVAVSRAKCLAVLVASPALLTIKCRTVEQMRLVNALCRFVELADPRAREA